MSNKFDELTKNMAQSVTRRAALKKFSLGLASLTLAGLGLTNKAGAAPLGGQCVAMATSFEGSSFIYTGVCVDTSTCQRGTSSQCTGKPKRKNLVGNLCDLSRWTWVDRTKPCSF